MRNIFVDLCVRCYHTGNMAVTPYPKGATNMADSNIDLTAYVNLWIETEEKRSALDFDFGNPEYEKADKLLFDIVFEVAQLGLTDAFIKLRNKTLNA